MGWFLLAQVFSLGLDILMLYRQSEREKDIEIPVAAQAIADRRAEARRVTPTVTLGKVQPGDADCSPQSYNDGRTLTAARSHSAGPTGDSLTPASGPGAPQMDVCPADQAARECPIGRRRRSPDCPSGTGKSGGSVLRNWLGELGKLGYRAGRSTVRPVLKRHHSDPAPERSGHSNWRIFPASHQSALLATDFFTVQTFSLRLCMSCFYRTGHPVGLHCRLHSRTNLSLGDPASPPSGCGLYKIAPPR